MSWTRTRSIAGYLHLVCDSHSKWKYFGLPRFSGGMVGQMTLHNEIRAVLHMFVPTIFLFAIASWVLYSSFSILVIP